MPTAQEYQPIIQAALKKDPSLTDEQLRAVAKNYYAAVPQQQPREKSFLGRLTTPTNIGSTVGDVAGEAIGAPFGPVASIGLSGVLSGLGASTGKFIEQARDDRPGFQPKEILSTGLQEGALSAGTSSIFKGGAKIISKTGILEPLETLLKQGVEPIGDILGKGKQSIKEVIDKKVGDLPLKGLKINSSQLNKWKQSHKMDLSKWMNDYKLFGGNAIEKASDIASKMQDVFDDLALNSEWKIPIKEFNDRFLQEIKSLAPVADEGVKLVPSGFKDIAKKITKEWDFQIKQLQSQGVKEVTPKILTELRRMTDELIPKGSFAAPTVKNVNFRLRQIYNDIVYKNIEAKMLPETLGIKEGGIRSLGKQLNQFYDFLKIAEKQSNLGRGTNLLGLSNLLGGSAGAILAGPVGAVIGTVTPSILRNPDVLSGLSRSIPKAVSTAGKGLDMTGQAIKELPGVFGAMTRYLTPRGASEIINRQKKQ